MPSIEDWAAKAARRIRSYQKMPSESSIAAIIATFAEPLLKLLAESRREHRHAAGRPFTDGCCPQCPCDSWKVVARAQDAGELDAEHEPNSDEPCTCGADVWNKRIDDALDSIVYVSIQDVAIIKLREALANFDKECAALGTPLPSVKAIMQAARDATR